MSENVKEKAPKKSWFKGLKSEFKKIVWTDKKTLVKETTAVVVITVLLGALIAVLDLGIQFGVNFLTSIGA